ncbi:MAG: aminotransferase class V-fold PLP-dependent enzyme [candidate division Zixibacteria bacterium]
MALSDNDIKRARSNFAIDDGLIYINHASHSPLSVPARAVYDSYLDSWQRTMHKHDVESFRIIEDVRNKLASMINSESERVGLSAGTSYGFNVIAGGYPWRPGDNVIVSDCEFPAVVYPWLRLKPEGVDIRMAGCINGFIDEDTIISLADNKTRVIAVSWVQFYNGYRVDLEKLGSFCNDNDILLCVDGIQGMGAIPIDVPSLNIDLFTCGGQKWMLGPCGTGFFYLSERAEKIISTPYFGWLSVDWGVDFTDLMRYDLPPRKGPSKYEMMTYPFQDIRAFDASIDLLLSFDPVDRWEHIISMTDLIIEAVDSLDSFALASSREESRRSGILNFKTDDTERLFESLLEKGFALSFREGGIRVSPHFYNTIDEINKFVDALKEFSR